ncbi:MAG: Imm70 family immunity protein [Planctomycetota bacterium]
MSLYLTIFDRSEQEVEGVEVGSYADFGDFRDAIAKYVEDNQWGSKCPTLMLHSDCDGVWTSDEAVLLQGELEVIGACFRALPPIAWDADWRTSAAEQAGVSIDSMYACFVDVDGQPLVDRLIELAQISQQSQLPILFQ